MRQPLEPLVDLNYGENMKKIPTQNLVLPELIVEYEKQRMTTRFEPGDFDNLPEGPLPPVEEAEWILEDHEAQGEMYRELADSASFELRQRKGTRALYIVEVSADGGLVTARCSDGSYTATTGRPVL